MISKRHFAILGCVRRLSYTNFERLVKLGDVNGFVAAAKGLHSAFLKLAIGMTREFVIEIVMVVCMGRANVKEILQRGFVDVLVELQS